MIYELNEVENDKISFYVFYSEKGKITKVDDIRKKLKEKGIKIDEETLEKVFRTFEKQSEVDYFINKNAKQFLREQFDLWMYQYLYSDESNFSEKRIKELKILKDIAYKIIDFISQFEDELVKIWNKPKFVLNSNYVITLDRIAKKGGLEVIEKILNHKNFDNQVNEWKNLGLIDEEFNKNKIIVETVIGKELNKKWQFLPIDTKHFKDLELEILSLFDNLDQELDGWLIKSENYQALNTILPKFREKVQTIYIDPPYNTGSDEFLYNDRFRHSSWLTMMENRLNLARELMKDDGVIFVSIDDREQEELKMLMRNIFGSDKFISQIVRDIPDGTNLRTRGGIKVSTEYIMHFIKEKEPNLNENLIRSTAYKNFVSSFEDDYIETRLTNRGNKIQKIKFPKGIGERDSNVNVYKKEGEFINLESKEKIKIVKGDLIIEEGILKKDVTLEAEWRMPNVLKALFRGEEVFDDSGQKYEKIFFNRSGIPYIKKIRKKALIPSYLNIKNEKDALFIDLLGYEESPKEATIKPVPLLEILLNLQKYDNNSIILDFFAGSGTTAHAVMKLNKEDGGKRKFILVEMADYFDTVIIPRIKKVAYSFNWKDGKPQDNDGIGIFFKYFELEQYEKTLRNVKYESDDFLLMPDEDPYNQYIFMKDLKLLESLEIDYRENKVKVDLSKLYENIDVPETLSCVLGKMIKKISKDEVEFEDGEKINLKDLDYKLIKPLIWWER